MNYVPEPRNFLLPFSSYTSSHGPTCALAGNKDPTENEDKTCPWDRRTWGHPQTRHHRLPAESRGSCVCQHVLKFPSFDLSLHKSPIDPFATYWLRIWGCKHLQWKPANTGRECVTFKGEREEHRYLVNNVTTTFPHQQGAKRSRGKGPMVGRMMPSTPNTSTS